MLLFCPECNQSNIEIKMNADKETISCEHGHDITNRLPSFTKNMLKTQRDVWEKRKKAFHFHCEKCAEQRPVVLSEDKSTALCAACNSPLKITNIMLKLIREREATTKDTP